MKTLIIAPQPFFTPRGTPFSVYYRTLIMANQGMDIDLLTYGEGEDVDIPGIRIIRIPRFSIFGPVKIGPSFLKLFLDFFLFLWSVGLLIRNRYEIVHAHEESVFFALFLKKIFRFKLIYDMHSSLPQQLKNFKFTTSPWLIGLFEWFENKALKESDAVITICPELEQLALNKMPESSRHFLIENSIFEPVRLKNESQEASDPILIPEGKPWILYAGTFERYQGLELLISSFEMARNNNPDASLVLVGGSAEQVRHLREIADTYQLGDRCQIYGRVSQSQIQSLMDRASVQTSPRIEGTNTPLKTYQQLASGTPLVATKIVSHTQILDDHSCFLVEPNRESMAKGLLEALENRKLAKEKARKAKEYYEEKYSRQIYEKKIEQMLQRLK